MRENRKQESLRFEERLGVANRHAEVRAAETSDNTKRHADDLPIAVDQRAAGATRSGLSVVDNLVGEHITDVPLGNKRPDELAANQLIHDFLRVAAGDFDDFIDSLIPRASQNSTETSSESHGEQRCHDDVG